MPWPTKPAWSGSWPEPPPEISATLPGFEIARGGRISAPRRGRRYRHAPPRSRRGFRRASCRGVDELLHGFPPYRSFGIDQPASGAGRSRRPCGRARGSSPRRRDPADRSCGRGRRGGPWRRGVRRGWAAAIGVEEGVPVVRREVADVEDRLDMPRRDRRGIGRVGDLRDEAAVLAERVGEPLPRARRAVVDDPLQDRLVPGDGLRRWRIASGRSSIASSRDARANGELGAADLRRRDRNASASPAASRAAMCAGSPPMSPQRLTSIPSLRPASTTRAIRRDHGRMSRRR